MKIFISRDFSYESSKETSEELSEIVKAFDKNDIEYVVAEPYSGWDIEKYEKENKEKESCDYILHYFYEGCKYELMTIYAVEDIHLFRGKVLCLFLYPKDGKKLKMIEKGKGEISKFLSHFMRYANDYSARTHFGINMLMDFLNGTKDYQLTGSLKEHIKEKFCINQNNENNREEISLNPCPICGNKSLYF